MFNRLRSVRARSRDVTQDLRILHRRTSFGVPMVITPMLLVFPALHQRLAFDGYFNLTGMVVISPQRIVKYASIQLIDNNEDRHLVIADRDEPAPKGERSRPQSSRCGEGRKL